MVKIVTRLEKLRIGDRIRSLREARGLTLESLAHHSRVNVDKISAAEYGLRMLGKMDMARIAKSLGVISNQLR